MCKIHGYHYACGHFVRYRLSRCRGTFTKARRRRLKGTNIDDAPKLPACVAECYIIIASHSLCGSCLYEQFTAHWKVRISEAEGAYRDALDQGMKTGLGLWGWGAVGWGGNGIDDDSFDDGCDDDGDDGSADGGTGGPTDDGVGPTANKKKSQKICLKDEIERRRRTLETLRAEFSAESWSVRNRLPIIDRRPYSLPRIQPRLSNVPSPLRHEVFPEDVVVKEERNGRVEGDEGWCHYPTFQAFFVDTYGGGSGDAWEGDTADLTQTGAWDAALVANINFSNSLADDTQEPTGDESYYTEYNRFDTSPIEEDGTEEEDEEVPVMAYGPETRFPPLMRQNEGFAPGPDAAPP
ncbi:hypothetical protein BFW01_g8829 [Lasiodiplodia theobromae]|uniref:uncharacterized protein n=1 Tax=Lasiodiplodia theobromae TaxID=45133 RepID=UPI0015C30C3B|nr:uncharacterized protein LTHEOB_5703 [Lasiodiplodia theobromae]KAF4544694.1 hypothetical protein LTHEOB_5703 [Lasiodiplodia theobromae]KAF9637933.1 hypothetical protein BFW01_g8829 [Lasiodiplodia theobromae]